MSISVQSVLRALHARYPLELAEDWDNVGLIAGSLHWPADRVLLSVDIDTEVLNEAEVIGANLIISHHPLLLLGQVGPEFAYKQRLMQRAQDLGIALANAHTNADSANPGVSDAIADALHLSDVRPLLPNPEHPQLGLGRVGLLREPMSLTALAELVTSNIPRARARVAGRAAGSVRFIGIVGGAGDSLLSAARAAGVDVYITSDLRHHPVAEHLEQGGCPLIDINHQAAESLWLPGLAQALVALGVEAHLSAVDTAHWL